MKSLIAVGMVCLSSMCVAQTDTWTQDKSDDGTFTYAAVGNANGGVFGEFCYYATKNCLWTMSVETRCTENATAPVLVNTDTGTAAMTVQCDGQAKNGNYLYRFNWKDLEAALKGSSNFGIAFGLSANGFKVYRFNLEGMSHAQTKLESKFFAATPNKPTNKPAAEVL